MNNNFTQALTVYIFLGLLVLTPFGLLFLSLKSLLRPKPVPQKKQSQSTAVRWLATVLSIIYVGAILYPPIKYLTGGFREEAANSTNNLANSSSFSEEAIMLLAVAYIGFIGLVFLGTIICACLLTIRSLENPKKK